MTTYDLSRMTPGERTWFAATGLAFAYVKALGTNESTAAVGALGAFRSFVNGNREALVIAMDAGGFSAALATFPDALPVSGGFTADDGLAVANLVAAYFGSSVTSSYYSSEASIGRQWWSDLDLRIDPATDLVVQSFLNVLDNGPQVDAGTRLSAQASRVVSGVYTTGASTEFVPGGSSQAARAMAAAVAEATGATPGDAEVIVAPAMTITGRAPARESIPPWAVAVGATAFITLGGGLVYVLGKRKRWWR